MTMDEKLDIILLEIKDVKQEMGSVKQEIGNLKQEMGNLKQEIGNLKQEIDGLKQEMGNQKQEMTGLKQEMASLKQEMASLKQKMDDMEKETEAIKRNVISTNLHIENATDKNIQLIAENFIELTNKLNQAIPVADKNLAYEVKVNYLLERVHELEKEMKDLKGKIA